MKMIRSSNSWIVYPFACRVLSIPLPVSRRDVYRYRIHAVLPSLQKWLRGTGFTTGSNV